MLINRNPQRRGRSWREGQSFIQVFCLSKLCPKRITLKSLPHKLTMKTSHYLFKRSNTQNPFFNRRTSRLPFNLMSSRIPTQAPQEKRYKLLNPINYSNMNF
ncbi:hypothetical protein ACP275_08G215200 [Erythranthe tilingii]